MENSHVVSSGVRDERNYYDFQLLVVEAISRTYFSPGKYTNMCQMVPYKASHVVCTSMCVYQKHNVRLPDRW